MEIFTNGQRREGIDTRPMSTVSGNVEAEGRALELDSGHEEIVRVDHRPKGSLGRKGADDGVVGDAAASAAG